MKNITTKKLVLTALFIALTVVAFGYFFYETLFFETATIAIVNVPWNLLQGAIGVIISTIVMRILLATKIIDKLQN